MPKQGETPKLYFYIITLVLYFSIDTFLNYYFPVLFGEQVSHSP